MTEGKGDSAVAAYNETFGGTAAPGLRSASRIANWLQTQGRPDEAIDVLKHASESGWLQDSERSLALLQLQSLELQRGDWNKAIAVGWQLQGAAPPGDPSGTAGLKMLMAAVASGSATAARAISFSDSYRRFLDEHPEVTDPTREMAYAAELRREHKPAEAAAVYEKVAGENGAIQEDRAAALLALQRLRLESGRFEESVQAGMRISASFPQDLVTRMASWHLIRQASANAIRNASVSEADILDRALDEDLRASAQSPSDAVQRRAKALFRQFTKEANR